MTISLGDIKSFGLFFDPITDITKIDKLEIVIVSNTSNTLRNAKLEFLAQWYGDEDSNNTCHASSDYKTFIMNTDEDNAAGFVTDYNGIHDASMNYHFVIMMIHTNEATNMLGKSSANNKLVLVGRNMNYCGRWENRSTIFEEQIIQADTYDTSQTFVENNMQGAFPYIEFYQSRSINNLKRT